MLTIAILRVGNFEESLKFSVKLFVYKNTFKIDYTVRFPENPSMLLPENKPNQEGKILDYISQSLSMSTFFKRHLLYVA